MADEAIESAMKLKSVDALHFIESTLQLDEASTVRVRQAIEKLQGYGDNPLKHVFGFLSRGNAADD